MSERVIKCPYRSFKNCIVEECPSCNYKEIENEVIGGIIPDRMSIDEAVRIGYASRRIKKTYEFVSCKLIDSGVQPIPEKKEITNNNTRTSVMIKKSLF